MAHGLEHGKGVAPHALGFMHPGRGQSQRIDRGGQGQAFKPHLGYGPGNADETSGIFGILTVG